MIKTIDVTALVNQKSFDHRSFISWLYKNIGKGIAVGSIYELKKDQDARWCWESGQHNKREFIHLRGQENANLFNLVWM